MHTVQVHSARKRINTAPCWRASLAGTMATMHSEAVAGTAAAAHPLHTADVLSRVLALLGMEHWPAAAQVCHGWRSASVAKAVEWRVLQPEPAAALLTGVPVGAAAVVCVVALPDGTLCSSDTVRHQLLVTAAITTAADQAAAANIAADGRCAALSAAVLPRRLGRRGHLPGELERPTGLVCDLQGERLFIVEVRHTGARSLD